MALDVWIGDWRSLGSKLVLSFEEEAYYWFIEPLVEESCARGGKYFDLYDGAEFKPDELHHVEEIIARAREQIESKPQRWNVKVGTELRPKRRELFVEVERERFLEFLAAWQDVVKKCRENQKPMFLYGD